VEIDRALIAFVEYEEQCLTEGESYMNGGFLSKK
jgi:hypothetical protein